MSEPYVLVIGNPVDGFTFQGPFADSEAATDAGEEFDGEWWIAPLGVPHAVDRLSTPGKTYDHDPRPDDDAEPGNRCRTCGEDITWVGPSMDDWLHVDDEENR